MENINLAITSSKLGSVICCDVVSIMRSFLALVCGEKGFMVEYFIRLPVSITILFSEKLKPVFNAGLKVEIRIIAQQAARRI